MLIPIFFKFVGGATAEETLPLLSRFRAQKKGVLFAYSVEVDERAASLQSSGESGGSEALHHRRNVREMLHSIDVAGDFEDRHAAGSRREIEVSGRKTWVAIKLVRPNASSSRRLR